MVKAVQCGFGNSPKICRLTDPMPEILDLLNPISIGFDTSVKDYYCVRFQVTVIKSFRFIMLTHTHTRHTYIHHDK